MSFYDNIKAFPINTEWDYGGEQGFKTAGMDLRDYFAAKAMQALIGLCYKEFDVNENKQEIAENAYELANSMMEERK
jgi:hypothetical protein